MEIIELVVGELDVNCYIIGEGEKNEWAVIDPGGDAEKILDVIRHRHIPVKFIINTHGHPDHTGANSRVKKATGAPLYIHKDDANMLSGLFVQLARSTGIKGASSTPDYFLKDGEELFLGDTALRIIHTPGHTRGGICILTDCAIFTGDTLFAGSIGRTDLPGGSLSTLLKSIKERLFLFPDELVVYPGHGPKTTLGEEKHHNPFL